MGDIKLSREVTLEAGAVFQTIMRLQDYPEFLPYCSDLNVLERDHGTPVERATAILHVQFGPISQAYTSKITANKKQWHIEALSTDGPFRRLVSEWRLAPTGTGCHVSFQASYSFKNPMIAVMASKAFEKAQTQIMDAFLKRAEDIMAQTEP